MAGVIGLYVLGFVFYALGYPERAWPGRFDFALHSHQLWHLCVVAAVLVWYSTSADAVTLYEARGCAAFL